MAAARSSATCRLRLEGAGLAAVPGETMAATLIAHGEVGISDGMVGAR